MTLRAFQDMIQRMSQWTIKRALISVYDKTGIVDFARTLVGEFGIEIISTGGTAKLLKECGIPVTLVEQVTGFPEMLDGRVKTLHPKIHAAILADRDNPEHMRQLREQGIEPIDMVVVNLYPFEKTVADPSCTFDQAIEMIDIGGPCMLRAAAKNNKHVLPVYDAEAYREVLRVLRGDQKANELYLRYASGAFEVTCCYDGGVARWLGELPELYAGPSFFPIATNNWGPLRYGENPHQPARLLEAIGADAAESHLVRADALSEEGEQRRMSLNNYADAHAALELCKELTRATTLLCGTGVPPVSGQGRWPGVAGDQQTRRNLPDLQTTGRTYFVTFRTRGRTLPPEARTIVLETVKHWDGKKLSLHAAVVMPDHVHVLLTPFELEAGASVNLGEIIHSVKSFSAHEINRQQDWSGPLWLDERWDRIMRSRKEFVETYEYIETNPDRANLGQNYPWFWRGHGGFEEGGLVQKVCPTEAHRRDAGATRQPGATLRRTCVFIKHTNACGVGIADEPVEAYRRAYHGDPNAAMGGILACNFNVDPEFAATVMDTYARWGKQAGAGGFFAEVWIAPKFAEDAVEHIRRAKPWGERVRLLSVGDMSEPPNANGLEYKSITGGMLVQSRDLVGLNENQWETATTRTPTEAEMSDLRLAWLVAKHTKSNAISICKDGMLIGNGAGQMSRVMSCRIATWLAKENGHADKLEGSVAASDAFFPFPDGPSILIDAGVTAVIQPGGSKRDEETIAVCNERNVAMIFTGTRHFKH
jgi:AICAR transformylase/IMP cyclohydrolase PurH/REP element-mobilizing transposase RayT